MKNRVDIRDFITQIENNFPINDWEIFNIKIWPFIRIKLFFYLIGEIELKKKKTMYPKPAVAINKVNILERGLNFFKYGIKARLIDFFGVVYSYFWIYTLPKKDIVFLGTDAHRVMHNNSRFNRYFDVFIEENKLKDKSIYFEYDNKPIQNYYNKELVFKYNKALDAFRRYKLNRKYNYNINFKNEASYSLFLDFLLKKEITKSFATAYNIDKIKKWFLKINYNVLFFKLVLKKINPKKILVLCYYSDDIMSLIHVANLLEIKTIEMQHGSQTDAHLAYGSWSNIPKNGYTSLPREYWCWDEDSANILYKWIKNTTNCNVKVVGNFWINYWTKKNIEYKHKNYILYSLQPLPITIEELFPKNIIELIKKNAHVWFIRIHPRQYEYRRQIEDYLKLNEILTLVNIEDATNDPLPLLLQHTIIHITHSSTTVIEASFFNKLTILINEIGKDYFPELINKGYAKYININEDNFIEQFEKEIELNKNEH